MNGNNRHYLTFRVGREWYGMDVGAVVEVLHMLALNEVPDKQALGVMTLREMIVPVYDLRQILGTDAARLALDTPIIAVHTPLGVRGFIVDEADDVTQVNAQETFEYTSGWIQRAFRHQDRLIFILNAEDIVKEVHT